MSTLYQSHSLPPDSKCIRVLDVHPPSVPSTLDYEAIHGTLRVIDLDDQPCFTALSYVWGVNAPTPDFILYDDTQVTVTSNGHSALKQLRKTLGQFTIWVDAIYINQSDEAEKEQQIPFMGDIYSKAKSVFIWLGDGTLETDRAMTFLESAAFQEHYNVTATGQIMARPYAAAWSIYSAWWSQTRYPLPLRGSERPPSLSTRLLRRVGYERNHNGNTGVQDLCEFLDNGWMRRVWTYQEILLASQPVVVCGDEHIPWCIFERSLLFLDNTAITDLKWLTTSWIRMILIRERLQMLGEMASPAVTSGLEGYVAFVKNMQKASRNIFRFQCLVLGLLMTCACIALGETGQLVGAVSLASCALFCVFLWSQFLASVTGRRCLGGVGATRDNTLVYLNREPFTGLYSRTAREPKDMAYGMWAVLARAGATGLPRPDYSINIGDLYRTFSTHLAQVTRSPQFLLLAAMRRVPGRPSWVPDWAAYESHDWGDDVGEPHETVKPRGWSLASTIKHRAPSLRPGENLTPYLRLDETTSILTIRGERLGDGVTCMRFRRASDIYTEGDRGIHLENLRLLLECAKWRKQYRSYFPYDRIPVLAMNINLSNEQSSSGKKWRKFYLRNATKDLTSTFDLLQQHREMFRWHVRSCNILASQKRMVFSITGLSRELLGACSYEVEDGDRVVRIEGLPQLLVLRFCHQIGNAVTIVSPAKLHSRFDEKRFIASRNGLVEYQIR